MNRILVLALFLLFPLLSFAGEKVKGANFFVVDNQNWETSKGKGYWMFHGKGVSHTTEGSLGTEPVECHGAGFWDKDGSWGEGICLHGTGDDTRTSDWRRGKGEKVGQWKMLGGTGKFAGITGEGTYSPTPLPESRHLSEWEGEITLPK